MVIDGRAIRSCHTSLSECAGKSITTIEGLERDGKLHPLQEAFLNVGAMQCGYCTPGMIMNSYALLRRMRSPTTEEIGRSMEGNVCRCGTYPRSFRPSSRPPSAMRSDRTGQVGNAGRKIRLMRTEAHGHPGAVQGAVQ